jgi:hypothetical protein
MGRKFGALINDVWRSASDLRFYGEVARMPFGTAFRHLLKVAVVAGTIVSLVIVLGTLFLNDIWRWCREALPVVTIRDGEASAAVAQPHCIERPVAAQEKIAVILDTTGAVQQVDQKYIIGALIQRRGIVVKMGEAVLSWSYSANRAFTIDRAFFDRLIVGYAKLILLVSGVYGGLFALLFAQSAAVACIGEAVVRIRGLDYSYREVLQMSFYALALAVCFLLFLMLFGIWLRPSYSLGVYAFIHVVFLLAAILTPGGDERAA